MDPDIEQLVRDHGPRIYAMCRRLDGDPDDAYQGVWEKVLRALGTFDPQRPTSFGAWIGTIARRHLIDRHRRRVVRGVGVEVGDLPAAGPSAVDLVDRAQQQARLEAALARLPVAQRFVVVQHHIHGVPLASLAEDEGVSIGTIKSRLHRGRARLAQLTRSP